MARIRSLMLDSANPFDEIVGKEEQLPLGIEGDVVIARVMLLKTTELSFRLW